MNSQYASLFSPRKVDFLGPFGINATIKVLCGNVQTDVKITDLEIIPLRCAI